MSAYVFDGKSLANKIQDELSQDVKKLKFQPCLAVALVGKDPASEIYVRNKQKACEQVGIRTISVKLPFGTTEGELLNTVYRWNEDPSIHGILVQLPLPEHIDSYKVVNSISPLKDVDGFHAVNLGSISHSKSYFYPCTPLGVMFLLREINFDLSGKQVCIINDTIVVGRPLAMMCLNEKATVVVCNQKTPNVNFYTREADVVVTAVGKRPKFHLTSEHIKEGSIVIDVGINRVDDKIIGDVDFEDVKNKAGFITPVPGCCGPLTISFLLKNTIKSAQYVQNKLQ